MSFVVIIPARYASTRLPGKPLHDINGKAMIVHVMEKALASGANRVIVATDHEDIARAVKAAGGEACMTSNGHISGTERIAEVIRKYGLSDDTLIVNVQGDEPMTPPALICQVAENLVSTQADMATLAAPGHDVEKAFDPNTVKVVTNREGYALYFSRAPVPWDRNGFTKNCISVSNAFLHHIGIYAYRAGYVCSYANREPAPLEQTEMLEQLRALWYGDKIHVAIAKQKAGVGVDTLEDLAYVRSALLLPTPD